MTLRTQTQSENGFTLTELVLVVAVLGLVAGITIPGLKRSRMAGNEAAAIAWLKEVASAEATFAAGCGNGGFAGDLASLTTGPEGKAPYIPAEVVGAGTPGYQFALGDVGSAQVWTAAQTCNKAGPSFQTYFADARPLVPGATGVRYFATNPTRHIKQAETVPIAAETFATAQPLQ